MKREEILTAIYNRLPELDHLIVRTDGLNSYYRYRDVTVRKIYGELEISINALKVCSAHIIKANTNPTGIITQWQDLYGNTKEKLIDFINNAR